MWVNSWSVGPAPRRWRPQIAGAELGHRARALVVAVGKSSASRIRSGISSAAARCAARRNSATPLFWDRVDAAAVVFCALVVMVMAAALWLVLLPLANGQHVT
jgi:hypothetical protein